MNIFSPVHLVICSEDKGNEGMAKMYGQTALGKMNAILDNRVQMEPAQVVRGTRETPLCNLAQVFTLNEQGSNLMGISEQKLQNADANPNKKDTNPKTTTNTKQKLKSVL